MIDLKEKTDSWKDVIPVWAEDIFNADNMFNTKKQEHTDLLFKLLDSKLCMSAEVHGGDTYLEGGKDECSVCEHYSFEVFNHTGMKFVNIAEVDLFVRHVREDHSNLIKRVRA